MSFVTPTPRKIAAILLIFQIFVCSSMANLAQNAKLPPSASRNIDFARDIQPLLARNCYSCHGPEKQKSDLRWDSKESVFKKGEHGPVLIPRNSAGSRVIRLVAGLDPEIVMPP